MIWCKRPPTSMYCLKCDYNLRGLRSRLCPECGRPFDPADRMTFREEDDRPRNSAWLTVGIYIAPLAASLVFWLVNMAGDWGPRLRDATPVYDVISIWMWQATGPLSLPLAIADIPILVYVTFFCIWPGYLALVLRTRLRQLPYVVHAVLACSWSCSGCVTALGAMSGV